MERIEERTKCHSNRFQMNWVIENYSLLAGFKECIKSPIFQSANSFNSWQLMVHPKEQASKEENNDHTANFTMNMMLVSCPKERRVFTSWSVEILYPDGRVFLRKEQKNFKEFNKNMIWGWSKFTTSNSILGKPGPLGDDDALHLNINVHELSELQNPKFEFEKSVIEDLRTGFTEMYLDQTYCDVTLVVEPKIIMAHKVILASASSVFNRMFNSDMQETKNNQVIIKDIEYKTLRAMVDFIYGIQFEPYLTADVFIAAEKYDITPVKEYCISKLISTLSVENAVEYMLLGDLHRAELLKKACVKFIAGLRSEQLIEQLFIKKD